MEPTEIERPTAEDMEQLQKELSYRFQDTNLLLRALTHPSFTVDQRELESNQRLEFLGDAALQLVISRELHARFPEADEGPLSKARAELVRKESLASHALRLNLGAKLRMSLGEIRSDGRSKPSALADAYEAVIGAIFEDGGYAAVERVLLSQFDEQLSRLEPPSTLNNPKGALQERLQSATSAAPEYEIVSISGPDHQRVFECRVLHEGKELGRGIGPSKKVAESHAATEALNRIKRKR